MLFANPSFAFGDKNCVFADSMSTFVAHFFQLQVKLKGNPSGRIGFLKPVLSNITFSRPKRTFV
jgi:hypothetical protein